MNNKDLQIIFDEFNEKPIVYNRIYSKITGSVTAGLLLSQLVYWNKAMNYKEFYKTDDDFTNELGMGLYELKSAKKRLQELEIINITRKGIPAKSFYTVNIGTVITLITSYGKNPQLDNGKTHNLIMEKPTTTTEITSEITSEKRTYMGGITYETIYIEAENFLNTWNKVFLKNYELTDDFKALYSSIRKKYSLKQLQDASFKYCQKVKTRTEEDRKKYELHIYKFLKQKNNGFITYI